MKVVDSNRYVMSQAPTNPPARMLHLATVSDGAFRTYVYMYDRVTGKSYIERLVDGHFQLVSDIELLEVNECLVSSKLKDNFGMMQQDVERNKLHLWMYPDM